MVSVLSIRDDKDDEYFRHKSAEHLHLLKLRPVRGQEDRDGIRLHRHPESLLEGLQRSEEFQPAFRDDLLNGRFESLMGGIVPARIIE